jgi:hypothetical protein
VNCPDVEWWKFGLTILGYAALEYWLGKTSKVRPASLIELIICGVVLFGAYVLTKVRTQNGTKGNEGN